MSDLKPNSDSKPNHLTQDNNSVADNVQSFRNFAPYINAHRGKTFVIMFGGEAVLHANFRELIHDFALLHSLGIRLVLVHGARPQIACNLAKAGLVSQVHHNMRITPTAHLPYILEAVGAIRLQIEAQLSMGLVNSPMYGSRIDVVSGNFITARPYGVRDGVDYQMAGEVRAVDTNAIRTNLNHGHMVILGSAGFSATGEIFNLLAEEVALETAMALQADKLIFLGEMGVRRDGELVRELMANEVQQFLGQYLTSDETARMLSCAAKACHQGIERTHILSYTKNGALIGELFTRDGVGTLISRNSYEHIRKAVADDVAGLLALLQPLQEQGILVERGQARLEQEIDCYSVIERDGMMVGCVALYPLDEHSAELASLAIHPDYQSGNRGADLLVFLEHEARRLGFNQLFALTTRTAHWFVEQGFVEVPFTDLPTARQASYHNGRNSKVLKKVL